MKHLKNNSRIKIIKVIFLSITGCILISSCATKVPFKTSDAMPEAEGRVKVKKDNNKNYDIDIDLTHLDKPGKLRPSKDYYIVWMQTENDGTKNLGQIVTSSGLFSKKKKASFNTVTPYKPTKIFITGENDPTTLFPNGDVVITTKEF